MEIAFSPAPVTLRLHQALAASAPEPLTRCELAQRLGVGLRTVDRALAHNLKTGCISPTRRLDDRQGHAYTVSGGGVAVVPAAELGGAHV